MTQLSLAETSQRPAIAYGGPLLVEPRTPLTLPQALHRAAHQEHEASIIYFQPDGTDLTHSYAALSQEAEDILAGLRAYGLQAGEKVILQVEENRDYLPAFWACVLGGFVAVPISIAPSYIQPNITTARLQKAWELCAHPLIVASSTLVDALRALGVHLDMENVRVESVEALRSSGRAQKEVPWHKAQPDDDALILFTSGSTGVPKGVTLTHRNILGVAKGFTVLEGLSPQEVTFNWMPLDHIGGLVTFHLRDVFLGCQQIHASPQAVLQSPLTWLDCLARYRATCTWAPNFAFSRINEQAPALAAGHWDLSSLRYILNAGEAIVPKTARRFLELLAPHGLVSSAIHPSWGMSETASGVTFSSAFSLETTSDEDRFVDVGALIPEVWVRIVDLQDQMLMEGEIGRIQVRGPTVTRGYYNNAALNREVFTADGWFDTGDLGMLRAGRLTATGRSKQIIIINGLNYYSHEIEAVVEEIPGVEATFTAACAVRAATSNTDALAIFYHTSALKDEEILGQLAQIRRRVIQAVGINPAYLLPLEALAIPKTETGKIQRTRLKELFEEGAFASLLTHLGSLDAGQEADAASQEAGDENENAIAVQLTLLWQRLLALTVIPPNASFFELGGDSLLLMQLLSRIRETFGIALTSRVVFDFPTVAALAREIEARQKTQEDQAFPQLVPVAREIDLPLSFTQRRLWFLEQLRPGDTAYSNCSAFRLSGQLSLSALEQGLWEIARRHEVFRTTFIEKDERPVLRISPFIEIPLLLIDLGLLPADEREHAAYARLLHELERPFDLAQGPLCRFLLLRLRPDEHIFATVISHLVSDGWSLGIFNRELAELYDAFRQGKPSPLPDLPLQFADYAFWQHQWFRGEVQRRELAYWQEHLQGAPALLELPTDHPRQPVQAGRLAVRHFDFALELTQSLNVLAQRENVTLFMLLLAALKVLLYRYTHQPDIVVGTVTANRGDARLESLLGFFANTLALRTILSESLSFCELLQKIREEMREVYSHAEAPFEQVVNALHIEQNLSYAPLLQVTFFLQDEQMYRPHFSDLQVKPFPFVPFPLRSGIARFDLLLEMTATEAGLAGSFEYDSELFAESTILRMVEHWQTLLEGIAANPHQTVAQLPLLTAAERHQLLVDWNATAAPLPEERCLHQLFEERAENTPHALAATCEGVSLTYRELNVRANQLAHYLQRLGVGPEVLVGIYLERSLAMLVALLGVLKAGGAYVALDPKLPRERLAFQLNDAQVAVLLTQERLRAGLTHPPVHVLSMDTQSELLAQQSTQNPLSHALPTNLAYLIYTSGSTGKPKGVQVLHRGLLNVLLSMQQQPGLDEHDVMLAITTISFDIAGLELFLPLLCGARVVIASQEVVGDSALLAALLTRSEATVMQATPATWRLLLANGWEGLPSLKALCGGEALPRDLANQLLARTRELWNLYGPTETTIWSTVARVEEQEEGAVTIGHPVANTQIYLLDKHLQPVPVGVTGELYIGGSGLARGYFRRPELTRERFLPHPFSEDTEQRLYLTGDLARYLPDGSIEYLGRNDFQVKVRGYRIELEEIEAALLQHPAVSACVVTAVDGSMGNKQLVAYLIPRSEQTPDMEELRRFLEETLPAYMLPAFFLPLQEFPLTPNGKVDRKALPAPNESRSALAQSYVAPQTPAEQLLANLWSRILRIERIGIYDNFFSLGGDSLLSMSVLSGARKQGLDFSLQEFFQYPRIHDLARVVEKREAQPRVERKKVQASKLPAQRVLEAGEVPLLPGEGWQLFTLRNPHQFNFPLLFGVRQPLDLQILQQTIHFLVGYHDALRLRFRQEKTGWKQFLLDRDQEEFLPITCVDLSTTLEAERRETAFRLMAEAQSTLHLCHGPLGRVIYFDMGAGQEGRLLWFLNHIICDFISHLVLAEDFILVYRQLAQGKPAVLPGQRTSLKRWAESLYEHISSAAMQTELEDYWLKLPWDQVKRLPADFPEQADADSFKAGRSVEVVFSEEETSVLLRQVLSADTQALDVFFTALAETFAHWTGSPWLPLYASDHGREPLQADMDLTRTVGFLSWKNLYLLHWENAEPRQALQAIRKQREATPNKGRGFEMFYYASDQRARLEERQIFSSCEVLFNYLGRPTSEAESTEMFQLLHEPIANGIDTNDRREPPTIIQVIAIILDDCLHITWDYSENLYRRSTIEQLAQSNRAILLKLINALARK